jgi:hypothetical protein
LEHGVGADELRQEGGAVLAAGRRRWISAGDDGRRTGQLARTSVVLQSLEMRASERAREPVRDRTRRAGERGTEAGGAGEWVGARVAGKSL